MQLKQAGPIFQCWSSPLLIPPLTVHRKPADTHVASTYDVIFPVVPVLCLQRPLKVQEEHDFPLVISLPLLIFFFFFVVGNENYLSAHSGFFWGGSQGWFMVTSLSYSWYVIHGNLDLMDGYPPGGILSGCGLTFQRTAFKYPHLGWVCVFCWKVSKQIICQEIPWLSGPLGGAEIHLSPCVLGKLWGQKDLRWVIVPARCFFQETVGSDFTTCHFSWWSLELYESFYRLMCFSFLFLFFFFKT